MKIIDLLNKIANGEEVPKKIKFENEIYIHTDNYCYYCDETNLILSDRIFAEYSKLNAEVEIIEEDEYEPFEEDKKIEKIQLTNGGLTLHENNNDYTLSVIHKSIINKINEIIDKLNSIEQK